MVDEWATRVDIAPDLLRLHGLEQLHCGWWAPPRWPGKGPCFSLSIPECELIFSVPNCDGGDSATVMVNRPEANHRLRYWLRHACEGAAEYRAVLQITADTAEQVAVAAKLIVRLLPH